jgi:hypothetical protein
MPIGKKCQSRILCSGKVSFKSKIEILTCENKNRELKFNSPTPPERAKEIL